MPHFYKCFHCKQVFNDETGREHFGSSITDIPACQIDAKHLRQIEQQLEKYQEEDTDLHRRIASLQTKHTQDLMRAEERGYAKGLEDGRKYPIIESPATPCPTVERNNE